MEPLKVLLAHDYYRERGGEDGAFEAEKRLLETRGHSVTEYVVRNESIRSSVGAGLVGVWNPRVHRELRALLRGVRPDVVHFHNTFPLLSPAAYYSARAESIPVVQTLHNYRLICPAATFFRDGSVCERCTGALGPWAGVRHGCYRGSRAATGAVASMLSVHRALGTWRKRVAVYVALTEFARRKLVASAIPDGRVAVKPNFLEPDPGIGCGSGAFAFFAGRLTPEKGIETLLEAWAQLPRDARLEIAGDGPLRERVAAAARRFENVRYLGPLPADAVLERLGRAALLVLPSRWYEGLPLVLIESLARGTPILASRIGSLETLIQPGRTGFHVQPGDVRDLAERLQWAHAHRPVLRSMRRAAREEFESRYSADGNYGTLLDIYARARCGGVA